LFSSLFVILTENPAVFNHLTKDFINQLDADQQTSQAVNGNLNEASKVEYPYILCACLRKRERKESLFRHFDFAILNVFFHVQSNMILYGN